MSKDSFLQCLDLKKQHHELKNELFSVFEEVFNQTAFSGGPFVEKFEKQFSSYIGTKYCVGVNNGTSALHLAMMALGIGAGDEVIVPANTFIATAWGVSHAGATPVFIDCDKHTWEMDPLQIEKAITKRTKAIIGVHLYGQPFDIDSVKTICDNNGLFLIEDSAQAQGAIYNGDKIGTFGIMSCFSFYPGKNLGACGEAGGITTNNEEVMNKLKSLRNHGSTIRYYHDQIGYNYRMGGLEAGSLTVKLKYLDRWNDQRRHIAKRYQSEIKNPKITLQKSTNKSESVYHLFVVLVDNRDAFVKHLEENQIAPAYHYPVPCHLQKAYQHLGYKVGDLPHSEYLAANCVSLPMYPELTDEQVEMVIKTVNSF